MCSLGNILLMAGQCADPQHINDRERSMLWIQELAMLHLHKLGTGTGKVGPTGKALALQSWGPEFYPQHPLKRPGMLTHSYTPTDEGSSWGLVASQRALCETLSLNVTWGVIEERTRMVSSYAHMHAHALAHMRTTHNIQNVVLKENGDGWSNDSAVKSTWCFCRDPSSHPSILVGSSQLFIKPTSGKHNTSGFLVYLDPS